MTAALYEHGAFKIKARAAAVNVWRVAITLFCDVKTFPPIHPLVETAGNLKSVSYSFLSLPI